MESSQKKPLSSRISGIIMVVAASMCWSSSGIFINHITWKSGLSAVGLAFWRDLITSIVLFLGLVFLKPKLLRIKLKDLPWLIGMGVISIGIFHIFWVKAVVMLGASLATVVQCNAPIFVTIMAWVLFREHLTSRKISAVILAAAGTILVSGINNTGDWKIIPAGLLIGLGSAITYGTLSLFGKKLSGDYNAWTIMFYIFSIASLTLFVVQLGKPEPFPIQSGVLLDYSVFVLFSTIAGFGLYTMALRILPASVAAITATTEILFASILAFIFLNERMDLWQVLGAALIISGVMLVSLTPKHQ